MGLLGSLIGLLLLLLGLMLRIRLLLRILRSLLMILRFGCLLGSCLGEIGRFSLLRKMVLLKLSPFLL